MFGPRAGNAARLPTPNIARQPRPIGQVFRFFIRYFLANKRPVFGLLLRGFPQSTQTGRN